MNIQRAPLLTTPPMKCEDCLLSSHDRLCVAVANAIVKASVKHNPTIDMPTAEPARTEAAANLLESMIYRDVAQAAGIAVCRANQALYNQTATESPLAVMI